MLRFGQLIRVVLLGLAISLPAVARADIIEASDPDSSASDAPAPDSLPSDSPAPDSPASDSSADTSSTDPASSDSSSSDSTPAISDLASIEAVEVLIDPSEAPSLLEAWVADSSGYNLENLDAGDIDPSAGDTSFPVSGDTGFHHCTVVPTPEPGSLALWTLAVVGIAGSRRLRKGRPSRD